MATACILTVIGLIVALNSGSCDARPRYEYSSEQFFDDAENDLKGTPTKTFPGSKTSLWNSNSGISELKNVIPVNRDDVPRAPESQLPPASNSASLHKPVLDRDRVLDQLHDHTGYKQPMYHSAMDGWVFG